MPDVAPLNNNAATSWWRDPGLLRLNAKIALLFCAAATVGFDASLVNGLQAIPAFIPELMPFNTSLFGVLFGALPLGVLLCLIPASWTSDCFGRRICIAIGCVLIISGSIAQATTNGPWNYFGTRFVIGGGIAFAQIAAAPLVTELAHPRQRAQITNSYQTVWYAGSVLSACTTVGCLYMQGSWSWRLPTLLQGFFPVFLLIGVFFVPESPRWLVSKGRDVEAKRILAIGHANGDENDELVCFEMEQITKFIEEEKHHAKGSGYKEFLMTKGNRHRLFICLYVGFASQWVGNGVISYYLTPTLQGIGITSAIAQAGINLGLQAWNMVLALVGAFLVTRFGRRPMWLASSIGMTLAMTVIVALTARYQLGGGRDAGLGYATVVFFFVFFGFFDIGFTPLSVAYPLEILNFRLRSKGMSINFMSVFAAGFFNNLVNPIAIEAITWKLYLVYLGVLVVTIAVIYFTFPETKQRTLEEIGEIFDGPSGVITTAVLAYDQEKTGIEVTCVE